MSQLVPAVQLVSMDGDQKVPGYTGLPASGGAGAGGARFCCEQLERGQILFFSRTPFELSEEDRRQLLGLNASSSAVHKNIAYKPHQDRLTGAALSAADRARVHDVMWRYSQVVQRFLELLLPAYAAAWKLDYASFRPVEEKGRPLRLRARNDLLHTDAFPTRPTGGNRILRVFTNINPERPRVWESAGAFPQLLEQLRSDPSLRPPRRLTLPAPLIRRLAGRLGVRGLDRPPYDDFMLRFHHHLKENQAFQASAPRVRFEFPPDSSWIVFTDMVSHAARSGQYALEHTFLVHRDSLLLPEHSPASVLERSYGYPVA